MPSDFGFCRLGYALEIYAPRRVVATVTEFGIRAAGVHEVDPDAVKAAYKHGVLTVTLPKPPEAESGARTIPVNA